MKVYLFKNFQQFYVKESENVGDRRIPRVPPIDVCGDKPRQLRARGEVRKKAMEPVR
jgi:hypothetical protein